MKENEDNNIETKRKSVLLQNTAGLEHICHDIECSATGYLSSSGEYHHAEYFRTYRMSCVPYAGLECVVLTWTF